MTLRHFLTGLLTLGMLMSNVPSADAAENSEDEDFIDGVVEEVPEDIYKWVQSTARANYYFNFRRMGYQIDADGFINLDVLLVPALFIYDDIQKEDVISKRRWRNKSREGYDTLVGRADYLEFRLTDGTVQVTERVDLDEQWGTLDTDRSGEPIELSGMSRGSVECKFYRAILLYAKQHNSEIIANSSGKLSPKDRKLSEDEMPIMKLDLP